MKENAMNENMAVKNRAVHWLKARAVLVTGALLALVACGGSVEGSVTRALQAVPLC